MEDPGWSWPYWKFSLERDDLFGKLHDQYNTFPSSIQDPEAFHHDVFEISTEASTLAEFERLMAERKTKRLSELNTLLESASLEIIANPELIGRDQWQYAAQLFRTKSFDSLVRYFVSYLPVDHPWHRNCGSDISSCCSASPTAASDYGPCFFDDDVEDDRFVTHEPEPMSTTSVSVPDHIPPTPPRSMTLGSEGSTVSSTDCDHHKFIFDTLTPARTLSFSESEPERIEHIEILKGAISALRDDEDTSQSEDPETPTTSLSDTSEVDGFVGKDLLVTTKVINGKVHDEYCPITKKPIPSLEPMDSETPTPKPETVIGASAPATSFFDVKLSSLRRRSLSPNRTHPHHAHTTHRLSRDAQLSLARQLWQRVVRKDRVRGRGRAVEGASRMQKSTYDGPRSRPRGRRRVRG